MTTSGQRRAFCFGSACPKARKEHCNVAADYPEGLRVVAGSHVLAYALRLRLGYGSGGVDVIVNEHRSLLGAIKRHDVRAAGGITRRHRIRARDDLLKRGTIS